MIVNKFQVENIYSFATCLNVLLLFTTYISAYLILLTLLLTFCFMEVVIHDGVIREKPSTPEEARKFIKGLCYFVELELFNNMLYLTCPCPVLLDEHILLSGYSESHAATIGSVLVTNVKTGARREGWDKAEVLSKFLRYFIFGMSTYV